MSQLTNLLVQLAIGQESFTTKEAKAYIRDFLKKEYSQQYVIRVLNQLIEKGVFVKSGSTRGSRYFLASKKQKVLTSFSKTYTNKDLEEHLVFEEVKKSYVNYDLLAENVQSIFYYAFSEMMNNAIEHSYANTIKVAVEESENDLLFTIHDQGIGVFRSVKEKKHLENELAAIQDLLKGKTTTQPLAHSGEGIFFTSKVADIFTLESFDYKLQIDNIISDIFLHQTKREVLGTKVSFHLSKNTSKHLSDIFKQFQTDPEYGPFDKTQVTVRLYSYGTIHISRSQARRLLHGLEKFNHVILDFEEVPGIGQAFADEIFRVFQNKYPDIVLEPIHMVPAVEFMVNRVRNRVQDT